MRKTLHAAGTGLFAAVAVLAAVPAVPGWVLAALAAGGACALLGADGW